MECLSTALNGLLAAQLENIINDKNFLNLKTPRPPKLQISVTENKPENINCQKCHRNCRKLLAAQLEKIINDKNSLNLKTPRPPKLQISVTENKAENINCQKFNRNCRKRAVQCDSWKSSEKHVRVLNTPLNSTFI